MFPKNLANKELYPDVRSGEITSLPFGSKSSPPFSICFDAKISDPASEPEIYPNYLLILDACLIGDPTPSPLYISGARPDPKFTLRNIVFIPNTAKNAQLLSAYKIYWKSTIDAPLTS